MCPALHRIKISEMQPATEYRLLARYYDRLFNPARGPFCAVRERILRPIMARVSSACDLGCGTGDTALSFAARGIRTFAVDLSAGMCHATREKVRRAGASVRVIHADMRNFVLPAAVDLVTCECDAVNHVPRRRDLRAVAHAVSAALRPGGYFFFDVNNAAGFKAYWRGNFWIEQPGIVAVMRSGNGSGRAWSDVEIFVREGSLWRRRSEHVDEVCWTSEEIEGALHAAGFDDVRSWDAAPLLKSGSRIGPGCRTFYLARKS
jgi:SAM-dependent methyltransferase